MSRITVPFFMGEPMSFLGRVPSDVELTPTLPEGAPQERMGVLCRHLADLVAAVDVPTVVAGDCVAAIGVLAGLQRKGLDPTVLWFDAHGDFHTWDTTGSGFLGGMPLAMLTGRGEQTIVAAAGLQPIGDGRVVLVGARDLDPGEDAAVASSGMRVAEVADVPSLDLPGPLYVHLDVDVVDPDDLPAVNYPVPGGPSLAETLAVLEWLAATGRVVALSVSAWNPRLPGAEQAAAATLGLAAPFEG
ncbi:MAG: arginase family protein [Actinobacteria bacterium]|nr:arginase family protein [Actinomycetota bacterium]MBU1494917.1 arginase family protein [Actinomycetota bacterium]MBU1866596.1 arginase family protein [Actinomycetota bacterium]